MPTSVLLAVLAAAGLLALAPALVRRYDATERLVAERALSTARVLARAGAHPHRRRRTVPGRRPVNPPRLVAATVPFVVAGPLALGALGAGGVGGVGGGLSARGGAGTSGARGRAGAYGAHGAALPQGRIPRQGKTRRHAPRRMGLSRAVYRRRRVLAALVLLNAVELVGVIWVGPGFWISAALSGTLLLGYLVHLRNRALVDRRGRRLQAQYAAWIAAKQAAIRHEQARRAAVRREALHAQLEQREQTRREAARNAVRGVAYEARVVNR